jgi:hypothetical protein
MPAMVEVTQSEASKTQKQTLKGKRKKNQDAGINQIFA